MKDALHQPRCPDRLFIGGEWIAPATSARLDIISPVSELKIASVPEAAPADIDRAVAAARRAFDTGPWPRLSPNERAAKLRAFAAALSERAEAMSYLWTLEAGAPQFFASRVSMGVGMMAGYYADLAESHAFVELRERAFGGGYAAIAREPVGVVAAVVPWNAPIFLAMIKLAPALAMGCTVVVKPAPETPLDAYILGECAEAAGLPAGTVNIVAAGRESSDHLIRHPGIDKVAFTGSSATGTHIMKACADRLARVTLELGGKSAGIILDDIAVEDAVPGVLGQVIGNCGQACVTLSRILVPRRRQADYADAFSQAFGRVKIGDPFDTESQIGTLAMKRQFERVNDYVAIGKAEGARLVCGGGRPASIDRGYFFEPTLFAHATNDMRIAREEIFGPVITMIPYDSEDEAIAIANDSDYGLHGALFTHDVDKGYALARQIRTGNIGFSDNTLDLTMPFGGFKRSGLGREGGPEGLAAYTETKTIYLPSRPRAL
ncbi:aldehyde dehydrogenase [Sphingomonas sp. Root710]|nr:aldehyde dehydrogenase [Sphingomonas sp. Root710]